MKVHPAVIPVAVITVFGAAFAGAQIFRSSYVYSDVSFRRYSNPHPYLHIKPEDNIKFFKVVDYGKVKQSDRPEF
jgi:NADH dehydrogenase (ubiquinone) 1 alpha subcomplex subunit 4